MTADKILAGLERPIGITILAALYGISVFFSLLWLVTGTPTIMIFGKFFSGVLAQLAYIISIIIRVYLAYGFTKLLRPAWMISIILELYGLSNILISNVFNNSYLQWSGVIRMIFSLFLNLIILAYIIRKSDYFIN